ncbi:hypothetical protein GCM10022239_03560 [Leifsonia bigeumensis]|uniref:Uncharacterized protein n=1 Tax=Leifsonella bigeumensis TaxID=433643 RepID=A0ABP7F2Q1_9MICO
MSDDTRKLIERLRTDAHHPGVAPATALQAADALEASLPTEDDRGALIDVYQSTWRLWQTLDAPDRTGFPSFRAHLVEALIAAGFRRAPVPPETDEGPWTAWDGIWRTIPQDRAEQARVLMTWTKRELVEALIAERQADLQRTEFGIRFLEGKVARLEAALAAVPPVTEETEWEYRRVAPDGRPVIEWTFESMPLLDEGWSAQRRSLGQWVPVPEGGDRG